jgi:hypothetical protein
VVEGRAEPTVRVAEHLRLARVVERVVVHAEREGSSTWGRSVYIICASTFGIRDSAADGPPTIGRETG